MVWSQVGRLCLRRALSRVTNEPLLRAGSYTEAAGFQRLQGVLQEREGQLGGGAAVGRMYYLALPPSVYAPVVKGLKEHADMQPSNPK
jgi:glucose-6-phosphate 1-dehydrogenase